MYKVDSRVRLESWISSWEIIYSGSNSTNPDLWNPFLIFDSVIAIQNTVWKAERKSSLDIYIIYIYTESSVLVQLCIGYIGLVYFLNKARVPLYNTGQYQYQQGLETPRYIVVYCSKELVQQLQLWIPTKSWPDFVQLVNISKKVEKVTR